MNILEIHFVFTAHMVEYLIIVINDKLHGDVFIVNDSLYLGRMGFKAHRY